MPRGRRSGASHQPGRRGAYDLEQAAIDDGFWTTPDERTRRTAHTLSTAGLLADFARLAAIAPRPGECERVQCPTVFSLVANPAAALRTIREFVATALSCPGRLEIDHTGTEQIGLCAGAVMLALARQAREDGSVVDVVLPTSVPLRNRLAACGLEHVVADLRDFARPRNVLVPLDRMPRDPEWSERELEEQASDHAERVVNKLKYWLASDGCRLDGRFHSKFLLTIAETLDNAVYHSASGWWICADLRERDESVPLLEVTIFSFGKSMAESLGTIPPGSPTDQYVRALLAEHERRGAFGVDWTQENLLALCAIQDGITRFGDKPGRGGGTHAIVKFFQYLVDASGGDPDCRLGWLSGHTSIVLDGRYRLGPSRLEGRDDREDIAFNHPNDLREPPDPTALRNLDAYFPGTLLKLEIPLGYEYLIQPEV